MAGPLVSTFSGRSTTVFGKPLTEIYYEFLVIHICILSRGYDKKNRFSSKIFTSLCLGTAPPPGIVASGSEPIITPEPTMSASLPNSIDQNTAEFVVGR